jgi:hypothetical protein
MFDEALLRELMDGSDRVPAPVVAWLVTGPWPAPALSCDVSFPRADYCGLLDF